MDKKLRKAKKTIDALHDKWRRRLGLLWWQSGIVWEDSPDGVRENFYNSDDSVVIMRTHADWRYLNYTIHVNLIDAANYSVQRLEDIVIHELCHVLVNEMREEGIEHEERVATTLQMAFVFTERSATEDANAT